MSEEAVEKVGRGTTAVVGSHCNGIGSGVAESRLEGRGRFRLGYCRSRRAGITSTKRSTIQ